MVSNPKPVAHLVPLGDRRQVIDPAVRSQGGDGFVFGPPVLRAGAILPLHLDRPLALDRTGVAAFRFDENGVGHLFTGDGLRAFELPLLEIARGQNPGVVQGHDKHGRPEFFQILGQGGLGKNFEDFLPDLFDFLRIGKRQSLGPADGDGPKILGPHHRPHPGPPVGMLQLVHHAGVTDHLLPGRPALGHADSLVPELFPDQPFRFPGVFSPNFRSVADLRLAVLDPDIYRLGRPAFHDDPVKPCHLQLRPEKPPRLRFPESAGQGRTGGHGVPGQTRQGRPGDYARHKEQLVVGPEGIHTRFLLFQ